MPLSHAVPDALCQIYARSLFELVETQGGGAAVEATLGELEDILELARSDRKFDEFLASRTIPRAHRDAAIARVFSGRCSPLTLRFLRVLNDKERLASLPGITAAFDALVQHKFGRIEVDAFTVEALAPDQVADLRARLSAALQKDVVLHSYVDHHMIGGIKLRIGDQLVDASLATRLRSLQDQLSSQGLASLRARIGSVLGS